ncbi:uncharacterized protein SPPG_01960 [Spizellomyces punctatus DAOM BR117]|uniref:RRM domain-containing protein n=1 Tax=Spizellomyces punctatus (strain DAOM BR117) TaxID=645134 RepID=A0A0L0HPZ1_SPIPD|nr:uncharacterized protein SPPG_01960 [Spizellomyces punctatus DAOM BR117]KND02879.1 hypothetical protein SPPG_01960 [Spizellomyces punctatus DAOM BR117]|eukprot:XP_016610918.1 hypothetical protein SPPG_01960 [Spizellomyces punctatus DAOM BR117]
MAKKGGKKAEKMSLTDFLMNKDYGGSWADDVADLPSAPAAVAEPYGSDSRGYAAYDAATGRGERDSRPQAPLPDNPPYTCFLGNLAYDVSERDIATLFGDLKVKNIRIVMEPTGKPKGFGYAEFFDRESLAEALKFSGESVMRRSIRIDVAQPPADSRRGPSDQDRPDRSGELEGAWRRAEPLPPSAPLRRDSSRDSRGEERRGFGGGFRREDRFGGRDDGFRGNGRYGDDRRGRGFGGDRDRYDRSTSRSDAPMARKKLELVPRTRPITSPEPAENAKPSAQSPEGKVAAEPKKPKSNPFGAAKPRDEQEIMKQIEERRQQREAEKRAAEEAEKKKAEEERKKQEEEKKKQEEEQKERERKAKEEQEQQKREAAEKVDKAGVAKARKQDDAQRPRDNGRPERRPSEGVESRADAASSWRRDAPLKPAGRGEPRTGGRRDGERGRGGRGGFGARRDSRDDNKPSTGRGESRPQTAKAPKGPKPLPTQEKEQAHVESKNVFDLLGEDE